ncbi:MAG: dihydroorotase [Fimbriimonadaceae bacterium]|nr:dihydroorotase [Fimbriimonadaceae bacterium]
MWIRNADVASSGGVARADVLIRDGRIVRVGQVRESDAAGEEPLDATGLTVLPGLIDTQVHFREPGMEHKEDIASGSLAAVCGGVTTFFEMPNTVPTTTTAEALADKLRRSEGRSWANYAYFVGATTDNAATLTACERLPGTPGIKIFMGSSTGTLLVPDDATLEEVLRNGSRPCPIHAEDHFRLEERKSLADRARGPEQHPFLRDAECARRATARILALSEKTGRPVHVLHVSTLEELPLLAEAKSRGLRVSCEVTPQHLTLAAPEAYERLGSLAQMNPPIRGQEHREALWSAVRTGLFDVFGSDHAPHTLEEKAKSYPGSPSGMPGVQTMLPVLLTHVAEGRLELGDVVRMACENPARLYGVARKGTVREGFDADLCLVDLAARWTFERSEVRSRCGWSPFEGMAMVGRPIHTFVGGTWSVRDGEPVGHPSGQTTQFTWKDGPH